MNFATFQKGPTFFHMCNIDYWKQIKSSHVIKEIIDNEKNGGLILNHPLEMN
jgi:hypothetical protein